VNLVSSQRRNTALSWVRPVLDERHDATCIARILNM
jgi:hypothetical protein